MVTFFFRFFFFGSLLFSVGGYAEGTEELMPDSANSKNCKILIANGNVGGNTRDPFAIYNGNADYRLFIHISDWTKEKIYFGIGASGSSAVTWRIHKPDGTVEWSGTTPTASGNGFIKYFSQAYAGPSKLDPAGYPAFVVEPKTNGDYFMTFQVSTNNSRTYEKFDITVIDTVANEARLGRVFSKAWQLNTNDPSAHGFYGKLNVYTNDGIVSEFDPNAFDGRWFTVSCNESGCYPIDPTHNAQQARRSVSGWHNYPQYKIFLNDPDTTVYPSGTIGQLVAGSVSTLTSCDDGTILFIFQTTANGTVEITLDLSTLGGSYMDRILVESVTGGIDTVEWDGTDGNGVQIPSGSSFPFTLSYTNGLTHLPLWDVEGNPSGFKVSLVRPQGVPVIPDPNFYWDDSQVGGSNNSLPPGCSSTPTTGCHDWPGDWGDAKTINTWWYVVSTSTEPMTIIYKRGPKPLGAITGQTDICKGSSVQFSVSADPNSQEYHWTWPGGEDTTVVPLIVINFPFSAPTGPGQVTVHGINSDCGGGPVSTVNINLLEIPEVTTTPLTKTICNNTNTSITLEATLPGTTFGWRATSLYPTISGYNNGTGATISDILLNTGFATGTVDYKITPTAAGCPGDTAHFIVTVNPVAHVTNSPMQTVQCSGETTNIALESDVTGAAFIWIATGSSANVSGYSDGTSTPIVQTLVNSGNSAETVTYSITPSFDGCEGQTGDYEVTVYPVPGLFNTPASKTICDSTATDITLVSTTTGGTFTWTCTPSSANVTGFADETHPKTIIDQVLDNTGYVVETVTYHLTPSANNCDGPVTDFIVYVNPSPDLSTTPLAKSLCDNSDTDILLTSHVSGTDFTWTATGSSANITGFSNSIAPGLSISQVLDNTGTVTETVTYQIVPHANLCDGDTVDYVVTIFPTPELTNTPLSKSICNNSETDITLTSDVAGAQFTWTATGSSANVTGFSDQVVPTTILNQTLVNLGYVPETVTYQITPQGNDCPGPVLDYVVTVNPQPDLSTVPLTRSICDSTSPAIGLTSNVTGTDFTWIATGSSPQVTGYSSNTTTPAILIDQVLDNTGTNIETVTYRIIPHANDCHGDTIDYVVTVFPKPELTNVPSEQEQCNNQETNINLTAAVAGTLFTWTAAGSSGNITGFSDQTVPTVILNHTLVNTGFDIETVTYQITPNANGCDGPMKDYVVTVYPTPDLAFTPPGAVICDGETTAIILSSNVAGTTFAWTVTASSLNIGGHSAGSGGSIAQTLTNSGNTIETVTYTVTPTSNGCDGSALQTIITVNPTTHATLTPATQSFCSGGSAYSDLTATVAGTTFSWTVTASSPNLGGYSDGTGASISQVLTNSGFTIETVTYHVTPLANGCDGPVSDFTVTVFPIPNVSNDPLFSELCNGTTTNINLTSGVAGANFSWTATPSSANITGWAAGNGIMIDQLLTNTGFNTEYVTYHITPTANGCTGAVTDWVVTIVSQPDVYFVPPSEAICSDETSNVQVRSHILSATFTWTAAGSSANVTGYVNGAGPLIAQQLTNSGIVPETVTYIASPVAFGCPPGVEDTVIVTVNPVSYITTSPDVYSICSAATTNIVMAATVAGSTYSWTAVPSTANLSGFSDSNGPVIAQTLTNSGYTIDTVTYTVTPTAHSCDGPDSVFKVAVYPVPDLSNDPAASQICSATSPAVNLTSHVAGTLFTWTATGSSAQVSGFSDNAVPAVLVDQTLTNTSFVNQTVTYHLTPHANGCAGPVFDYVVTVYPVPNLSNLPPAQAQCNNLNTNIALGSDVAGTLFTWTCTPSSVNVSGFAPSAAPGILIDQLLTNSGSAIETVTYHVTPRANDCDGPVFDYVVTVYPTPTLTNMPAAKSQCNNTATGITLTSDVAGTQFTWTCTPGSANISGFSDQAVPTTLLNQTLVNAGFDIETVTYHIQPLANTCDGPVTDFVVTVYPTADTYFEPPLLTICDGETTNIEILSHVTGTTFAWTASSSSANISGFSAGSGSLIQQTLTNSGNTIETVTYVATPTANGCTGTGASVTITVNPTPHVTTAPLVQTLCSAGTTSINLTSSVTGSTFGWTAVPSAPTLSGFSDGNGNSIAQTLTNSGYTIDTVTYTVTPTAHSCDGPDSVFKVAVYPVPDLSNDPASSQICSATSPEVNLTSHVAGATFTWTATGSSANITGYGPGSGLVIDQVLTNLGLNVETVTYHVDPTANGCPGIAKDYLVTIVSVPDVYFNPPAQAICNAETCNIQNLSTVTGTTFTWTASGSSANLSGFSAGSGNLIAQTLYNSGTTTETVTYSVAPTAFGCPAGPPQNLVVTVYPKPAITSSVTTFSQCSGATTGIVPAAGVANSTFTWVAGGSSPQVTGYADGAGLIIQQTLTNSGFDPELVTYSVTPVANSCNGDPVDFTVTVYPVADVYFTPDGQTLCTGMTCNMTIASHVAGSSFTWTATGSSGQVSGYSGGSGTLIQQLLNNAGYNVESVTYQAFPTANGCAGTPHDVIVTVNPYPSVSFPVCFDAVTTTDAQPIRLRGGTPVNGTYSGPGVTAGVFYPSLAGAGTFTLTYAYTNTYGCSQAAGQSITVISPLPVTCGSNFTDIRDNQSYPTVQIGTQCWMAANLNYGSSIPSTLMQRDNCQTEKYCFGDNAANCLSTGGLYQWDELMRYDNNSGAQGFCPPGWHIPTEAQWNTLFNFYISSGFAGSPLKSTGYSGFNALLSGVRFNNISWNFDGFATILWSSTLRSGTKAWAHGMNTYNPSVSFYPSARTNAFGVRCLKD